MHGKRRTGKERILKKIAELREISGLEAVRQMDVQKGDNGHEREHVMTPERERNGIKVNR